MRRLLSFLVLLLCCNASAQDRQRLAGFVQLPDAPLSSYYLEITINGTEVKGYSITDYSGGSRLKAAVRGKLSPASELYIEETGSLDGPDARNQTYCYFTAHLKLTVVSGKRRWSGPFSSRQMDGRPCSGDGFMTIMENAPPLEDPKPKPEVTRAPAPAKMRVQEDPPKKPTPPPVPKPDPAPPKDTIKAIIRPTVPKDTVKAVPKPEAPKPRPVIVIPPRKIEPVKPAAPAPIDTNNCLRSYEWKTDSVSFDIWDGWTIDGDVISLAMRGRTLLDHAKLNESKQHFSLPLARGLNILEISLHEEGFDSPNTPNMILFDGSREYSLNISGKSGETARICIFRAQ